MLEMMKGDDRNDIYRYRAEYLGIVRLNIKETKEGKV